MVVDRVRRAWQVGGRGASRSDDLRSIGIHGDRSTIFVAVSAEIAREDGLTGAIELHDEGIRVAAFCVARNRRPEDRIDRRRSEIGRVGPARHVSVPEDVGSHVGRILGGRSPQRRLVNLHAAGVQFLDEDVGRRRRRVAHHIHVSVGVDGRGQSPVVRPPEERQNRVDREPLPPVIFAHRKTDLPARRIEREPRLHRDPPILSPLIRHRPPQPQSPAAEVDCQIAAGLQCDFGRAGEPEPDRSRVRAWLQLEVVFELVALAVEQ